MWLLQDGFRNTSELDKESIALDQSNIKYNGFGIIPFTNIITGLTDEVFDTPIFIRCGTKLLDLYTDNNINLDFIGLEKYNLFMSGIVYNSNTFDQKTYLNLDLPLLNENSDIYFVKDILNVKFEQDVFIKPTNDRKSFNAQFLTVGETLQDALSKSMYQNHFVEDICLVSKTLYPHIDRECRFFIVNNKVITGSHYRINNRTIPKEIHKNDDIWNVADAYATLYHPESMYVMDIAQVDKEYKIVEYNCLNASGLYQSDAKLLFNVINEVINAK